jgi:6-pyruvoyltetrahydropterin/6-carboxytetrahydropterin synthase
MTWEIHKDFYLEYGHRVWSQELHSDFCATGDDKCACRHLHGHSGKVSIHLEADELERGMVTDFKHIGFMKNFIDRYLDHKMLIDLDDPAFDLVTGGLVDKRRATFMMYDRSLPLSRVMMDDYVCGYVIADLDKTDLPSHQIELLEGFFFVEFLPTSENLCKYIAEVAGAKLKQLGVKVSKAMWHETPKSHASYIL